ncbi:MAG: hypothetical protein AB7K86_11765 [Rhodospirillales bacterium]
MEGRRNLVFDADAVLADVRAKILARKARPRALATRMSALIR